MFRNVSDYENGSQFTIGERVRPVLPREISAPDPTTKAIRIAATLAQLRAHFPLTVRTLTVEIDLSAAPRNFNPDNCQAAAHLLHWCTPWNPSGYTGPTRPDL